jgi:hypothetical protein
VSVLDAPLEPLLRRYPDGRKATVPLLEAVLLPFVALMFGTPAAAALAAYNAIAIRRWGLAAAAIALGIAGWLGFAWIIFAAAAHRQWNIQMVVVAGRALHLVLGGVLYLQQRRTVHGHQFLGGSVVPLRASYLLAFGLQFVIPGPLLALLLGVPPGR